MSVHRIRLRGPWQIEPTAAANPSPRIVRLPARWDELFDPAARRVRLSRRFHCPTNLRPVDEVSLVVDALPEGAQVALNGTSLGRGVDNSDSQAVFPTPQLELSNLLTVEFDVAARETAGDQIWGDVALVINSP
jgi:hypothetical protein